MRILHVIEALPRGGAEHYLLRLVRATHGSCRHVVVQLGGSGDLSAPLAEVAHVVDLRLDGHARAFRAVRPLRRLLAQHRPDVVQSWRFHADLATRLAVGPRRPPPIVARLTSPQYEPEARRAGGWPRRSVAGRRVLDAATLRLADVTLVGCSAYVADSYRRRLRVPADRVTSIPSAVDVGELERAAAASDPRAGLDIDRGAFLFVHVGRFDGAKGQEELVEAFAAVAANAPEAHLALVGDGPLRAGIARRAARTTAGDRVHLLGVRSDVAALLRTADAFVFPSRYEGLGTALLEAMALGVPAVASDIPALREATADGRAALLVPPGDATSLAAAMLRLHGDARRRTELAAEGRRRVAAAFDIGTLAEQWLVLWARLGDRGSSAARPCT